MCATQVTDVADGREATGKPTSIKLSTATGSVLYIADSETEQVEWISALEGAVARIVKQVCMWLYIGQARLCKLLYLIPSLHSSIVRVAIQGEAGVSAMVKRGVMQSGWGFFA